MGWKQRYLGRKRTLGQSDHICEPNRRLFKRFLRWEERKLKRSNGLRRLDEPCFKTLYSYTIRLANVNRWFENKPWIDLTRADIRRVYNGLEDGRILSTKGTPYEDLRGYYNKIFKAKPFELAKKDGLARRVIEYSTRSAKEVRFVSEDQFSKLVSVVKPIDQQALFWLAWDIGENIGTLLSLRAQSLSRNFSSARIAGESSANWRLLRDVTRSRRMKTAKYFMAATAASGCRASPVWRTTHGGLVWRLRSPPPAPLLKRVFRKVGVHSRLALAIRALDELAVMRGWIVQSRVRPAKTFGYFNRTLSREPTHGDV